MYTFKPEMLLWSSMGFYLVVIFISMLYIYTEIFHISSIATNATMVVYGFLFGDMHPVVFISIMCIWTVTLHVSIIAPNATMVVDGILFGGSSYIHDVYTDFSCINYSRKCCYGRLWDCM